MIKIYTQPGCTHCDRVKRWLDANDHDYAEVNVQEDSEALAKIKGWGFQQVPVVKTGKVKVVNPSNIELEKILGSETSVFDEI